MTPADSHWNQALLLAAIVCGGLRLRVHMPWSNDSWSRVKLPLVWFFIVILIDRDGAILQTFCRILEDENTKERFESVRISRALSITEHLLACWLDLRITHPMDMLSSGCGWVRYLAIEEIIGPQTTLTHLLQQLSANFSSEARKNHSRVTAGLIDK